MPEQWTIFRLVAGAWLSGISGVQSETETVDTEGVEAVFMRRIPPRSRPDFDAYCRHFGLPDGRPVSNWALLGLTGAKLPSDGFSLVDPLDPDGERCDLMLEVAGFRHQDARETATVSVGNTVQLIPEPEIPSMQMRSNFVLGRLGSAT